MVSSLWLQSGSLDVDNVQTACVSTWTASALRASASAERELNMNPFSYPFILQTRGAEGYSLLLTLSSRPLHSQSDLTALCPSTLHKSRLVTQQSAI